MGERNSVGGIFLKERKGIMGNLNFILILTVLYLVCCGLCESMPPQEDDDRGPEESSKGVVEMGRAIQSVLNPLGKCIHTS